MKDLYNRLKSFNSGGIYASKRFESALKSKKKLEIEFSGKRYDLVPLLSILLAENMFKLDYIEPVYVENLVYCIMADRINKSDFSKSSICQKAGLIKPHSETWSKVVSDLNLKLLNKRVSDYTTLTYLLSDSLIWNMYEVSRYSMAFLSCYYWRGLEDGLIATSLTDGLIDKYVDDKGNSKLTNDFTQVNWSSIEGYEIITSYFLSMFMTPKNSSHTKSTQNFIDYIVNDIALCKLLRNLEINELEDLEGNSVRVDSLSSETVNSLKGLYLREMNKSDEDKSKLAVWEREKNTMLIVGVGTEIDTKISYFIDSECMKVERNLLVESKYTFENQKIQENKKLNNEVKKLRKDLDSYKSLDSTNKNIIRDLRKNVSELKSNDTLLAKEKEIANLSKKNSDLEEELRKVKSKLESTLNRVDSLESKNSNLNHESKLYIDELEEELENATKLVKYYSNILNNNNSSSEVSLEEIKEELKDLKVCVIGGPEGYDKRLSKLSDKFVHIDINDTTSNYTIPQCDIILLITCINSHSHRDTAKRVSKSRGIPFLEVSVTNIDLIGKILYQFKTS